MPNTEHTLILTFAQMTIGKDDVCKYLVVVHFSHFDVVYKEWYESLSMHFFW